MTLKEELFNIETVSILANQIKDAYPSFETDSFIKECFDAFDPLELKERMAHVREMLYKYLPKDFKEAVLIMEKGISTREHGRFIYGSILEYIEVYGCTDELADFSLEKLGVLTSSLSSEFAVRPFFNNYKEKTLAKVIEWTKSDDFEIRRLASEGSRPSLPWAQNINVHYSEAAAPLDYLYYDDERYVTRSVANHLIDISKMDPSFVLNKLKQWQKEGKQNPVELDYMIKHSLRTLIKRGHKETLNFLGYKSEPKLELSPLSFNKETLNLGEKLEFEFDLTLLEDSNLMIDYTVYFPSKTNKPAKKTFKLKQIEGKKGETHTVTGRRQFRHMSTRQMRTGTHEIRVQINGDVLLQKTFELIV